MNVAGHDTKHKFSDCQSGSTESKLEATGWGLFLIWVGLVSLFNFGPGIALLGVGLISLVMQWLRKYFGLSLDGFWVVIGLLFSVLGLGALIEVKIQFMPLALVLAGILLLASALKPKS